MSASVDRPDANDRLCVSCKGRYSPYSMAGDGEDEVLPPVGYRCLSCRSRQAA